MKEKSNTIKKKVIAGFILAGLAMLLTGIISYTSYRELLTSMNNPSYPEIKLKELSKILADISEAEGSIRAYALTRDDAFLNTYLGFVSTVNQDFNSLKNIEPVDDGFNQRVDSINTLLDEKIRDLNSFIELKKTLSEVNFSLMALKEISKDSVPALRTTKTTTTTTTTLENLPKSTPTTADQEENSKRKKRKRVQELAQQIAKLEMEPMIQTETKIITDTSFIQPDTLLGNVNRILEELSLEESRYQSVLAKKELSLIEGNIQIIDQIRHLINALEKDEMALSISKANRAKIIASRSTLTVSIIIILCLITGIWLIYLIFKDISIRNFYNQQLIGAKDQAEELARSKQQFLANMSHEIRTPLNAIIGFTEQLAGTGLENQQKKYLQAVQTSGIQLLHTVNDILDYSKMEAGELKIQSIPFDLKFTLEEVTAALEIKAREKGLPLILEMDPPETVYLLGDPFRLKQILFNLVSNSIKFTDQGFVKLSCSYRKGDKTEVVIKVKDSGIGIKKEIIPGIFEDFNQADLSPTRKYEGTGLGLAICKKLLDLQGGKIEVESEPGVGSEFRVRLTYGLSEHPPVEVKSKPATSVNNALQSARLLVVDDDSFNLGLLEVILNKWHLQADLSDNPAEAMELLKSNHYDLILTDIHMPDISGLDLTRFVREMKNADKCTTPIIALTANVMENDLARYRKQGVNDILLKPYNEAQLAQKIGQFISMEASEAKVEAAASGLCSLDDFKRFSGGDDSALLSILETFQENLIQNIKALNQEASAGKLDPVAELAHKMISSFGHLKSHQAIDTLRRLEISARAGSDNGEIAELALQVDQLSKPVLKILQEEIKSLRKALKQTT